MSITSSQQTVQLKSMPLNELRDDLVTTLKDHQLQSTTKSLYDDELVMTISRNLLLKTFVKIERTRHRPLEVIIEVDYNKVKSTRDVIRATKPSSNPNSQYSFRWLWIPLVFGALIIAIINTFSDTIAQLFGSENLSDTQLIITVVILSVIISISWIYGVPSMMRRINYRRKLFDEEIMIHLTDRIAELDQAQIASTTRRCWSCFMEMPIETTYCPNCNEEQK